MTLQKEFYANFIVQRLTLKVINMDTLYLVFKDRFQYSLYLNSFRCPIDDNFSPQAKRHLNELPLACQAHFSHSRKSFSGMKQPLSRQNLLLREAARTCFKWLGCQLPCFRQRGIIDTSGNLSSAAWREIEMGRSSEKHLAPFTSTCDSLFLLLAGFFSNDSRANRHLLNRVIRRHFKERVRRFAANDIGQPVHSLAN